MEHRHTLSDGVGEIHDDINRTVIRNIYCIQPRRMRERDTVFRVSQEVDLVDVKRM